MINLLVKAIFWLITTLFDMLFSPIFAIIYALFPNVSTYFNYITSYLTLCLSYVRTALSLLLITDTQIIALFDYFLIKYSIYLGIVTVTFIIKIYNKFKP